MNRVILALIIPIALGIIFIMGYKWAEFKTRDDSLKEEEVEVEPRFKPNPWAGMEIPTRWDTIGIKVWRKQEALLNSKILPAPQHILLEYIDAATWRKLNTPFPKEWVYSEFGPPRWKITINIGGMQVDAWTDDIWIDIATGKAFINRQTDKVIYYDSVDIKPKRHDSIR